MEWSPLKMPDNKLDSSFIDQTYQLARQAVKNGNHPFGALLVSDNRVILTACNSVHTDNDVTAHAELNLVKKLSASGLKFSADSLTLYTSTEPCAMCSGAIYWSGIRRLVFGCSAKALASVTGGNLAIPCQAIFQHGKEPTTVRGPINETVGQKIHQQYW